MAKRRDYAAEYAARKQRARASGFSSEREYKAARREAREWSSKHSQKPETRYSSRLTPPQIKSYKAAWVDKTKGHGPGAAKRHWRRMRDYLVDKTGQMTREEFEERYPEP